MNFNKFINNIKIALSKDLPGIESQFKMAPKLRQPINAEEAMKNNPRFSGVMMLFYKKSNKIYFVLIKRKEYKGTHGGQMALPGGKFEEIDENIINTALRETEEEIGIDRNIINVIGRLTDLYIYPSNFIVTPVIGFIKTIPEFKINSNEVEYVSEVEFKDLINPSLIKTKKIMLTEKIEIDCPYFNLNNETVWGATAMMLSEFVELIKRSEISY